METPEQLTPPVSQTPATLAVPPDPPPETLPGNILLPPLPGTFGQETATFSVPSSAASRPSPLLRRLDVLLAGSVLLLAFFAASFIAVNSDFWLHLATGRLIAQGRFPIGVYPFLYTNGSEHWVHQAWLVNVSLYELYNLIGGHRAGSTQGSTHHCPRRTDASHAATGRQRVGVGALHSTGGSGDESDALLQPACLSLCLFGLTFWVLWLPRPSGGSRYWIRWAYLLLLLALWVNLDGWFWLGPFLVGLFWMGERLPFPRLSGGRDSNCSRPIPTWLLAAAFAVCLLNPDHLHVWWPPAELSLFWSATGLRQDMRFGGPFVSPWQGILQSLEEAQLASWAYVVLVGLGLLFFRPEPAQALRLASVGLGELRPLGCVAGRAVPFFAIVSAPITTLNLQDYLRRSVSAEPDGKGVRVGAVLGRLSLLMGSLVLVALAWPGWLQGFESDVRHAGWGVSSDPSLQQAAETIGQWRRLGRLGESDRGFALHPDIAHYCAWNLPRRT